MKHINWRSWLPAIGFAIALHLVFFGVFIASKTGSSTDAQGKQEATVPTLASNAPSDPMTNELSSSIVNAMTNSDMLDNKMADIKSGASSDVSNQPSSNNQDDPSLPAPTDNPQNAPLLTQTIITTKNTSAPHDIAPDSAANAQNASNLNDTPQNNPTARTATSQTPINALNRTDQNNTANDSVNARIVDMNATDPAQAIFSQNTLNNDNANQKPSVNPADRLLTKRDLPQAEIAQRQSSPPSKSNEIPDNTLTELEQTEAINNQLSALIDSVRARNAAQIAQDQQITQAGISDQSQNNTPPVSSQNSPQPSNLDNDNHKSGAKNIETDKPLLSQPNAVSGGEVQIIPSDDSKANEINN